MNVMIVALDRKKLLFSYDTSDKQKEAHFKIFLVIEDAVIKCKNRHFELYTTHEDTQFLVRPP